MNGANTESDWAVCKKEQEGPGNHYDDVSNTTGLVVFFFFFPSCKKKYLSWRITLIYLLSPTAHSSGTISQHQELKGLGPSPFGPKIPPPPLWANAWNSFNRRTKPFICQLLIKGKCKYRWGRWSINGSTFIEWPLRTRLQGRHSGGVRGEQTPGWPILLSGLQFPQGL